MRIEWFRANVVTECVYGVKFMARVWKNGVSAGDDTTHTAEQDMRKGGANGKKKKR